MSEPIFLVPSEALVRANQYPDAIERVQANVSATNALLDILEAEAARPDSSISDKLVLPPDADGLVAGDSSVSYPLTGADIEHPDISAYSYQVGINAGDDQFARIVTTRRERGGSVGRIVVELRRDQPTLANGWNTLPRDPNSILAPERQRIDGQLADPVALLILARDLPRAFDSRRGHVARPENAGVSRRVLQALGSLFGGKKDGRAG